MARSQTNEGIRNTVQREETMMDTICRRKLQLFGDVCRMRYDRLIKTMTLGRYKVNDWDNPYRNGWTTMTCNPALLKAAN